MTSQALYVQKLLAKHRRNQILSSPSAAGRSAGLSVGCCPVWHVLSTARIVCVFGRESPYYIYKHAKLELKRTQLHIVRVWGGHGGDHGGNLTNRAAVQRKFLRAVTAEAVKRMVLKETSDKVVNNRGFIGEQQFHLLSGSNKYIFYIVTFILCCSEAFQQLLRNPWKVAMVFCLMPRV